MNNQPVSEKEQAIVEAARRRFAHYGFSKVTMDEIASDVAMGKASLYYYFPTKESIFRAVIVHEQKHFITGMQEILATHKSAADKLREYADKRLLLFRDLLNLSNLPFQKFSEVKSLFRDLFTSFEKQELKLLHQLIQTGRRAGEFSAGSPQLVSETILHALHGLRLRAVRNVEGQRLEDEAYASLKKEMNQLVEVILNGIVSGKKS